MSLPRTGFFFIIFWVVAFLPPAQARSPSTAAAPSPTGSTESAETPVEKVIATALQKRLDQSEQWRALIDYRRDFYFWSRGQADNPAFYLGDRWDPRAELVANLRAIFDPGFTRPSPDGSLNERAPCIFPGRFLWLKRQLPEVTWPRVSCPRYENFRDILQARSATYVFSSYFLNNPSSAFGHTFLRLNRGDESKGGRKYELIDFGVGYTAVPTTSNAALYAFMGIAGFFPGRFETHPYYYKVREYNDYENRDLWEYDLNFTPDEMDLLVAHLFELDNGGFFYVYFTENCAYRILAAMEAVRPSLHLLERSKPYFLPSDSVAVIADTPGFVKAVHYRPSGRAIFAARLATLDPREKKDLHRFTEDESVADLIQGKSESEKRDLLDAAMDYVDFHYADQILHAKGDFPLKKKVLLARSEVALTSAPLAVPVPRQEAPDKAHGSTRLNLGWGSQNTEQSLLFGGRFVLHDLLDPVVGYPAYSEMEMGDFQFSWDQQRTHRLQLEDLALVRIVSLSPRDEVSRSISWRLNFGFSRLYQDNCEDCLPAVLSGGVGFSKEWGHLMAGLWLRGSAAYAADFRGEKALVGAGPAFLGRYYYSDRLNVLLEAWHRYDYKAAHTDFREASLGVQYHFTKDFGLRVFSRSDRRYQADFEWYF